MEGLSIPIQFISIIGAVVFLIMIFRLIVKGRLREEYSIVWIICTGVLVLFSVWRKGLHYIAGLLGVYYPPSLIFLVGILAIIVFLVHLSVVNSKMHTQIKNLTHEIAFLKQEMEQWRSEKAAFENPEATPLLTEK
jgi:hypothetical protein